MGTRDKIKTELQKLNNVGFLLKSESFSDISTDLHSSETWADAFWRRRGNHVTRDDPEIQFIFDTNPKTILEVGTAYGRVLNKIAEENEKQITKAKLFGIELCKHCRKYFQTYSDEHSLLKNCTVLFDDFFKTNENYQNKFDVIVLPMNTFPSFPITMLEKLFSAVKKNISPKGVWLFSTYKPKGANNIFNPEKLLEDFNGELLPELNKDIIAGEHYQLPVVKKDYGMQAISYSSYTRLTRDYQFIKREIYRNVREFINPDVMKQIISDNDFQINFIDNSSHSAVYSLSMA